MTTAMGVGQTYLPKTVTFQQRSIQCAATVEPQVVHVAGAFDVKVYSGWRSAAANRAAGGSSRSDHLCGYGIDFIGTLAQLRQVASWARAHGCPYVELVWMDENKHCHVSFKRCPFPT